MEINNSWQAIQSTCFWSLSFCSDSCSFPVSCSYSYSYSSLWIYSYSHLYPLLLRLFCRDAPSKEPELLVVSPPRSQSLPSVWQEESPGRTKSSNLSMKVRLRKDFILKPRSRTSLIMLLSLWMSLCHRKMRRRSVTALPLLCGICPGNQGIFSQNSSLLKQG